MPKRKLRKTIEPANNKFTVYKIGTYEASSVLAGQQMRIFVDSFDSVEEASSAFPDAELIKGSTYREPSLDHLPDEPDSFFEADFY